MIRRSRPPLGADDTERLNSWSIEIATSLLPAETKWHDEGDERKFHKTGLSVNRVRGCWYSHTAKIGYHSTIRLIEFLRDAGSADALQFAEAWLSSHPGTRTCVSSADPGDTESPSRDDAQDVLNRAVDPSGTLAETYWQSRRVEPPLPPCVLFLEHARCGESAAVGILTAHGRTVGVELTYLDHLGRKSTVLPQKRSFKLEKSPDAVFDITSSGNNGDVVVCEGLPDALTAYRWGACRCRLVGLPGIGTLAKLRFPAGTKVTVVAQGDAAGSPAAVALARGLDRLILDGCEVQVTEIPPEGIDANDILLEAGIDGVRALLASAQPAMLSLDGDIERLARLPLLDYERVRMAEAKRLGIRVAVLDEEVGKRRGAPPPPEDDWADTGDTTIWPDEVDGAELLDSLDQTIGRFVAMSNEQRWATALWVVFTHAFDAALNAPKLWVRSAEPRSGKTRLVGLLKHLVHEPLTGEGMTASAMVRLIEKRRPTMLLDEIDNWMKDDPDIRRVINSGFDPDGQVWIQVKTTQGDDWDQKSFSTWTPQLLAGLGSLHSTSADRSFRIELERKSRHQKVDRFRRTTDMGPIVDLRLKAARWAKDNLDQLRQMTPEMPEALHDRAADSWELCTAIADLAFAKWGERARQAALVVSGDGYIDDESTAIKLLSDIRDVFATLREQDPAKQRIASQELVERLADMEDRPWPEFKQGRPLTAPQLARLLRPFHISPGTIRLNSSASGTPKGYRRRQFNKAFERYLPPLSGAPDPAEDASPPRYSPDFADTPTQPQDNCQKSAKSETPQEGDVAAPKTPEEASVSAACGGVAEKNSGYGGKTENQPNGEDKSAPKRGDFAADIRAYAAANPGLIPEKIGKHFGCSRARVERILGVQPQ